MLEQDKHHRHAGLSTVEGQKCADQPAKSVGTGAFSHRDTWSAR